ncbi:uncharacterized protein YukE [Prauserella sediminis]|uniref:Uncharacterized protein YukE n=1 Tax=Prauserella sediminis TaxID=577680 RepID=A0A839XHF8_9PSEU|nr:hypothetical protein [Prauserella sediminis]MBB3661169.1 uncharacterized protein YukE [Prauserella sediminis]
MTDEQFPSLGFDPAPGNPKTVGGLAKRMTDTSVYAKEAHEVITSIQDKKDTWTGEAAKAFADKVGELPEYLDAAHTSLRDAGKALSAWKDALTQHQGKAGKLEEECRKAIEKAEQADVAAQQAAAQANTPIASGSDPASVDSARQQQVTEANAAAEAKRAAGEAWGKVDDIRKKARDLKDTWEDDARTCAEKLQDAAYEAPGGFWESVGDVFAQAGDWIGDHLGEIGDVAGMISAVAGALSFIPVLAPVTGPIALVAGGVALAAHGGEMIKEEKWDEPGAWVGLGADVLGVLPGVGAVSKGMSMATDSLQVVDGLAPAAMSGGKVLLQEAGQVAKPAQVMSSLGEKVASTVGGNADTIAKTVQNTFSLGSQVPTGVDMAVGNETTDAIKSGTGYVAGGMAGLQSVGQWGQTGSALSDLGSSLAGFARAVG